MTYTEFCKEKPILYGTITVNGKQKIGSFKPLHNPHSNSIAYHYYTFTGNMGAGGFTLKRAYDLFSKKRLSLNPANGDPSNYV